MKKLVLIFRKPYSSSFSIEYLFHELTEVFKKQNITFKKFELPFYSKGVFKRISNTLSLLVFPQRIVHITGDVYYAILGAWFSKRVITIHDLHFLTRTKGLSHFILKWVWIILPVKFAHKVVVISNATKEELLKIVKLPESKISVVYDFVDAIYQPVVDRTFNSACPKILHIGCSFNKNLERTIYAIEGLRCELILVGRLTRDQLALLKNKNIQFESKFNLSMSELHQQYLRADILCYPSMVEGFGMPIIEAQATGLPVITSNCSSMPEVAGKGALLINPLNVVSIKNGINKIIKNESLRKSLVEKGYLNVKRFTKEKTAADYIKVYEAL